jgi:hypothetical protein
MTQQQSKQKQKDAVYFYALRTPEGQALLKLLKEEILMRQEPPTQTHAEAAYNGGKRDLVRQLIRKAKGENND